MNTTQLAAPAKLPDNSHRYATCRDCGGSLTRRGIGWIHDVKPNIKHAATPTPSRAEASHTPGPWRVVSRAFEASVCKDGIGAIANLGGKVRLINTVQDGEQMRADARLIAAAPDLLAAAKLAVARLNALVFEGKNMPDDDTACDALSAAIARTSSSAK